MSEFSGVEPEQPQQPLEPQQPNRAWWLSTRRRRPEWQSLSVAGVATFSGRPKAHFEAAQPGDPVLLYISKPDHAISAVGVVTPRSHASSDKQELDTVASGSQSQASILEVQIAFEVPNPLSWRDILAEPSLAGAEPVKQRSSGTLFALSPDEYSSLQELLMESNPELSAAFDAVNSRALSRESNKKIQEEPDSRRMRETPALYAPPVRSSGLPSVNSLQELQALTALPLDTLEEARDLLEDTGQIVLYGPPGTGKTWLARGLAALVACDPARAQVVQFHPATTYEDFIEGLKPQVDAKGQVTYAVLPGLFVRLCEQARLDPEHNYVLVIDEINRAPLARVFGELLYTLEYRGPEGGVQLSVSAENGDSNSNLFYVPENLLLIGTMNSADRSLALVDYALRRRFRFVELEPNAAVLDNWLAEKGNSLAARAVIRELFRQLNTRLTQALDPDHRLGHSYFMLDPLTPTTLDRLWRTAIRPLITEYFMSPVGEWEEYAALFSDAVRKLANDE